MNDVEPLNASLHADLRINDADWEDGMKWQGFVEIVLPEFAAAATRYPIFFAKNGETGQFMAGMLHGIQSRGQIRTIGTPDPDAYVPFALKREGFFTMGEHLGIDPGHGRLSRLQGRPLFEPNGEPSSALRDVQQSIAMLIRGREPTADFIQALLAQRAVEPIAISLDFDDGDRLDLEGLYTVSLDQLGQLDDEAALALFRSGYLQLAYTVAGSLRQLSVLASQRNRLLTS